MYIQNQCKRFDKPNENIEVDVRLNEIVNRMVKRCLDDGQYKQALGLGLEARRMDIFKNSITYSVSFFSAHNRCFVLVLVGVGVKKYSKTD